MKKILFFISIFFFLLSFSANVQAGTSTTGGSYDAGGQIIFPEEFGLPDPTGGVKGVLTSFLNWTLTIIGIIALIAFVISGFQYFMSSGDEKMSATAKRNMTYSILGIIAALSGYVIILAVDSLLRGGSQTETGGNTGISTTDPAYQVRDPQNTYENTADYVPGPNSGNNNSSGYIPNEANTPDVSGNNVQSTP